MTNSLEVSKIVHCYSETGSYHAGGINIGFLSTVTIKFHRFQDNGSKVPKILKVEMYKRILIYNFKVYLVVAFCFALVISLQYDLWITKLPVYVGVLVVTGFNDLTTGLTSEWIQNTALALSL